jgi:hypothetical protein
MRTVLALLLLASPARALCCGAGSYVRCWSMRVREATAYPALVQQAQRLADSLAAGQEP